MTMTHLELPHNFNLDVIPKGNENSLGFNSKKERLLENVQRKLKINSNSRNESNGKLQQEINGEGKDLRPISILINAYLPECYKIETGSDAR